MVVAPMVVVVAAIVVVAAVMVAAMEAMVVMAVVVVVVVVVDRHRDHRWTDREAEREIQTLTDIQAQDGALELQGGQG